MSDRYWWYLRVHFGLDFHIIRDKDQQVKIQPSFMLLKPKYLKYKESIDVNPNSFDFFFNFFSWLRWTIKVKVKKQMDILKSIDWPFIFSGKSFAFLPFWNKIWVILVYFFTLLKSIAGFFSLSYWPSNIQYDLQNSKASNTSFLGLIIGLGP